MSDSETLLRFSDPTVAGSRFKEHAGFHFGFAKTRSSSSCFNWIKTDKLDLSSAVRVEELTTESIFGTGETGKQELSRFLVEFRSKDVRNVATVSRGRRRPFKEVHFKDMDRNWACVEALFLFCFF